MSEERTISTFGELAYIFGVSERSDWLPDLNAATKSTVGLPDSRLEGAISKSVYKNTSCGAWAKLENALPVGKQVHEEWLIDIRKDARGFRCVQAQRTAPEVGGWTPLEGWTSDLVNAVAWDAGLEDGYLLDGQIVEFLGEEVPWKEDGTTVEYFTVSFDTYVGGYAPGVSFGSIVEGVEQCTQVVSVAFPCAEQAVWDALKAVEDEATGIWNATHGCAKCWNGQTVVSEWGEEAGPEDYGVRPVDPECKECKGGGTII